MARRGGSHYLTGARHFQLQPATPLSRVEVSAQSAAKLSIFSSTIRISNKKSSQNRINEYKRERLFEKVYTAAASASP